MSDVVEITSAVLKDLAPPALGDQTDKDERGRALVVGGDPECVGGAILAGLAVLRSGAGKLQFAAPSAYAVALAIAVPEAAVVEVEGEGGGVSPAAAETLRKRLSRVDAVVVGPGMMNPHRAGAIAVKLLEVAPEARFLIDAAAMTGLKFQDGAPALCKGRTVLTPHLGEMCSLMECDMEAVQADPLGFARRAADRFQSVVALKSAKTFIAAPDGRAWCNSEGAPGLATCGSGDVLAGVIGGLLARGAQPHEAAVWGVYLHATAGKRLSSEVGPLGFLAREIPAQIPMVLAQLDGR